MLQVLYDGLLYNFTPRWVKGCKNDAPDALSCNPVLHPQIEDTLAENNLQNHSNNIMSTMEIRAISDANPPPTRLQDLRYHAAQDPEYQQLQKLILDGFSAHHSQLYESCRHYWNAWEHLSIDNNLYPLQCEGKSCQTMNTTKDHYILSNELV